MAMRLVKNVVPSFEQLGLMPVLKDIAESQRGIVLLAGSTGSGKSTTLARDARAPQRELPQAHRHPGRPHRIQATRIASPSSSSARSASTACRFERGMKHALRQDPDIILVGEMRDATSFRTAMSAADTGHLVHVDRATPPTPPPPSPVFWISSTPTSGPRSAARWCPRCRAVICQRIIPRIGGGVIPAPGNPDQHQDRSEDDQGGHGRQSSPPPLRRAAMTTACRTLTRPCSISLNRESSPRKWPSKNPTTRARWK